MTIYTFSFPTTIHFGAGARHLVKEHLTAQNFRRPLIVTDRGVAAQTFFSEFANDLKYKLSVAIFSDVSGNPVKSQVENGVVAYKAHEADSIIGIGGGAALDVAKSVALMATHAGDLFDYEDGRPNQKPITQPIPYWVALPTTSGTGSEVGRSSVISDEHSHLKKIIFSPQLLAKTVFADPELTFDLPAPITAATGMDALTHLVESYLAKNYHPICDGVALEGLRLVAHSLVRAVNEPKNIEARSSMMMASMMGAIAFQKGLGLTHSCAHALGTAVNMHHGLANGIMIPYAMAFNLSYVPERFAMMSQAIGVAASNDAFLQWLYKIRNDVQIPSKLTDASVQKNQLPYLIELSIADSCHQNNPHPVMREDFSKIFEAAFS